MSSAIQTELGLDRVFRAGTADTSPAVRALHRRRASPCAGGRHLELEPMGRGGLGPTRDAAYVFVLTIWRPTLERGVSSVVLVIGTLSRLPHVAAGHRGKMPLPNPTWRRLPFDFATETSQRLRVREMR